MEYSYPLEQVPPEKVVRKQNHTSKKGKIS